MNKFEALDPTTGEVIGTRSSKHEYTHAMIQLNAHGYWVAISFHKTEAAAQKTAQLWNGKDLFLGRDEAGDWITFRTEHKAIAIRKVVAA
jgi:hypothetical protein